MERKRTMLLGASCLASLAFALCSLAGKAEATVCEPEPTDMSVAYGERITCEINPGADTDLYRFSGRTGDRILAEAVWLSGSGSFYPQIKLIAPDGTVLGDTSQPARVDIILPQMGTYTAIISGYFSSPTGQYAFTVSCIGSSCLPPQGLPTLTLTLTGCINCRAGDTFSVSARLHNPASTPRPVEVKAGVVLPNGSEVNIWVVPDHHFEVVLPPGLDTTVELLSVIVPLGLPKGLWAYEGVLLSPELGRTLVRDTQSFTVQ